MARMTGDVLLLGSVPFKTVDDVFRTCGATLGGHLFALPDGEVGERSVWIGALPHLTYAKNPDLEPLTKVNPEDVKSPEGHGEDLISSTISTFKLRPGVTETHFDLHFTAAALSSYETFTRLREEGAIPPGVRFQVSLPFTFDAIHLFFPEDRDRAILNRAYEDATRTTVARILERVPAADLAIQWDYCLEVLDILGWTDKFVPWTHPGTPDERIRLHTAPEYLRPMSEGIPEEVLLGYHLCYGTWGGWPDAGVPDLQVGVSLANALVANTPHRVDYVHIPTMPLPDEQFFEPLDDLRIGSTKVFLGVELSDGVEALVRRAALARPHLAEFGIAHYCGYGREDPDRVRQLLPDLKYGAERLAAALA